MTLKGRSFANKDAEPVNVTETVHFAKLVTIVYIIIVFLSPN